MKKLILPILALFVISCAPRGYVDPRLKNLNLDYLEVNCVPDEKFQFPLFDLWLVTTRTKDCAGYDDLFVVTWEGENNPFNNAATELVAQMFGKYETNKVGAPTEVKYLKSASVKSPDSPANLNSKFYKVEQSKVDQNVDE